VVLGKEFEMSLYTSASGREVNHASSSSLDTFRLCRRKFKLSKIDGWREKAKKASLEFGKCIESAIQYYHTNGLKPGDATEEFKRLWLKWAEIPDLVFTDQEGCWKDLYTMGSEMTRLYEIRLPELPIKNPKWQLEFRKSLWPGSEMQELEFLGYIDLLSTLDDGTRIIVDIKTAKSALDVTPNMLSMDGQLRKYAWVSGIPNVGFLNFVKARPDDFKKGYTVTLLNDFGDWRAGEQKIVVSVVEAKEEDKSVFLNIADPETVRLMDEELDAISGKGSKERKDAVYQTYASRGLVSTVPREYVTKTKLQYIQTVIPTEELSEIGQAIGTDVYAIKESGRTGSWPQDGGVRFPNAVCGWCSFRGICLKNNALRDEILVQLKPTAKETDWLEELEEME
jgi:hypothetical protein